MKQSHDKIHPLISEITVAPFGKRLAHAARNASGHIEHYWIGIDESLFDQRLGPDVLASIIEPALWFDIAKRDDHFWAHSPQMEHDLMACETSSRRHASPRFDQIQVWCNERLVASMPRNRQCVLSTHSREDIISLGRAFSRALQSFLPNRSASHVTKQVLFEVPEDQSMSISVPFILVRESLMPVDTGFCRSRVAFH